jgi:hypothetical protein
MGQWMGRACVLTLVGIVIGAPLAAAADSTCYCVTGPDSAFVCLGAAVVFSVEASGEGPLAYQWYHGQIAIQDGGAIAGTATERLEISAVTPAHVGEYTVTVTGARGGVTSTAATLSIKSPTAIAEPPADVSVCPGEDASFSVVATGEGALSYQWHYEGSPLADGGNVSGATSSALGIVGASAADAGEYSVTVMGECGALTSSAATLVVKAPTLITNQPQDLFVCPGAPASFAVIASGEGILTYQWYYGTETLYDGGRVSGTTTDRLEIGEVRSSDAGQYSVVVGGSCGQVMSRSASLDIKAATVIDVQPVSLSVYTGESATFSVTATGQGPLAYQWYRDATPLIDGGRVSGAASPQLSISGVDQTDAGDYTVTVAGECGSMRSAIATLAARPPIGSLEIVLSQQPKDILLVLDLSSSMDETFGDRTKLDLAKEALLQLIQKLPGDAQVGLRTFRSCGRSTLDVPIQSISSNHLRAAVPALESAGKTAIAYTLEQIPGDLEGLEGPHVIVFVTDGYETCDGDPVTAARALVRGRDDLVFRLVGFDIARAGGQTAVEQLLAIADAANGEYVDVAQGDELLAAVLRLVLPPAYRVYDASGQLVAEGLVGTGPVELQAGTYSVEVETDPVMAVDEVVIRPEQTETIIVPFE